MTLGRLFYLSESQFLRLIVNCYKNEVTIIGEELDIVNIPPILAIVIRCWLSNLFISKYGQKWRKSERVRGSGGRCQKEVQASRPILEPKDGKTAN